MIMESKPTTGPFPPRNVSRKRAAKLFAEILRRIAAIGVDPKTEKR